MILIIRSMNDLFWKWIDLNNKAIKVTNWEILIFEGGRGEKVLVVGKINRGNLLVECKGTISSQFRWKFSGVKLDSQLFQS